MFLILVGFESHRKDSPVESLYVGHDSAEAQAAVDANLSRFEVVRLYKGPAYSKRWVRAEAPEASAPPAEAPEPQAPAPPESEPPAPEESTDDSQPEESASGKKSKK